MGERQRRPTHADEVLIARKEEDGYSLEKLGQEEDGRLGLLHPKVGADLPVALGPTAFFARGVKGALDVCSLWKRKVSGSATSSEGRARK